MNNLQPTLFKAWSHFKNEKNPSDIMLWFSTFWDCGIDDKLFGVLLEQWLLCEWPKKETSFSLPLRVACEHNGIYSSILSEVIDTPWWESEISLCPQDSLYEDG